MGKTNFDRYKHYASKACQAEAEGDFEKAAEMWEIAALSAAEQNKQWAEYRVVFCQKQNNRERYKTEEENKK